MAKPGWCQLLVRPHIHRKIKAFAAMDGILLHEYVEAMLLEHINRRGMAGPRDDRLLVGLVDSDVAYQALDPTGRP